MRALALLACLAAGPSAAFEPLTVDQCRAGWLALAEFMPTDPDDRDTVEAVSHRITEDGWCRLTGADPALRGAPFATVDWQIEGLDAVLAEGGFPMALRVRFDDVRARDGDLPDRTDFVPPPPLDMWLTLRRVPEARQLIVEEFRVTSPAGDDLRVTAVFDRVDLSSVGMAQMSMGSIALRQVNAKLRLNGWVESQIVPNLDIELRGDDAALRRAAAGAVLGLPPEIFDPHAIRNLLAFAGALPAPRGDLETAVATETGLGILQVVTLVSRLQTGALDMASDDLAGQIASLLGGLTVDVIWTPDPDQTE